MSPPDPRAAYLDAFRQSTAQPEGTRARNLAAIERRLGEGERRLGEGEGVGDEVSPPRPAAGRWAAAVVVMKSVSLSLALGGAGLGAIKLGAMGWSAATATPVVRSGPTAEQVEAETAGQMHTTSEAPPVAPPPVAAVPAPIAPPEPSAEPAATTVAPEAKPARRRIEKPSPSVEDRLREEVELMQRGRTELEAGRYGKLLDVLDVHQRRFPNGAMIEERAAWQAIAACELGRADAAQQAAAFIRRHPRSSLGTRVQRACDQTLRTKVTDRATPPDEGAR